MSMRSDRTFRRLSDSPFMKSILGLARESDPMARLSNVILRGLFARKSHFSPGTFQYSVIDRFYNQVKYPGPVLRDTASAISLIDGLVSGRKQFRGGRAALVFMMRGQGYGHLLHNYMVACCLRELGYDVSLVTCSGGVEHCGFGRKGTTINPPFVCNSCRRIVSTFARGRFPILDLNDYRDPSEKSRVQEVAQLSKDQMLTFELEGIPLLENLQSALMQFYTGDLPGIRSLHRGVSAHFQSAVRHMTRFCNLLDEVNPSCLCLFNGLSFPEHLFLTHALSRKIPTVCLERGMKRDTIFVAVNEAACHYRCDKLWKELATQFGEREEHIAQTYLNKRTAAPEDPSGRKRDVETLSVTEKYRDLTQHPYVILFAPVTYDTASMGKSDPAGGWFESLSLMCLLARKLRKRLIVRSHPDELNTGADPPYTVRQFMEDNELLDPEYVLCLDSHEKWNPYVLADLASGTVIYNGTLGMEFPALGYKVHNIASSHYSGKGFTVDLGHKDDFELPFKSESSRVDPATRALALRYLYYYVEVANLPCDTLIHEERPFTFKPAGSSDTAAQRAQLTELRERLGFLLGGCPEAKAIKAG